MTQPLVNYRQVIPVKVYYADTDSAGIVYYATYMRWMEMGRCEFITTLGPDLQYPNQELVVARAALTYFKPAHYGNVLAMTLWIEELTGLSFRFQYQFARPESDGTSTLLVEASTMMVCVDIRDYRLTAIPSPMLTQFKALA